MPLYYFGSKQSLYRAVLAEVYRDIGTVETQVVDSDKPPSEKLVALLEGYFAFLEQNPQFTRLILWGNLEQGQHFPKGRLTKIPLLQRFRKVVDEGVASGEFRADLDVSHLLINVMGLCFVYFSNRYSLSEALELDLGAAAVRERAIQQVKSVLLDGIRKPGFKPKSAKS